MEIGGGHFGHGILLLGVVIWSSSFYAGFLAAARPIHALVVLTELQTDKVPSLPPQAEP
jgi:hypothetical protein